MAKIYIERAYIEANEKNDKQGITVHVGDVFYEVPCDPKPWLYTIKNEDDDIVINSSAGMEEGKWDHLIREMLDGE